MPQAGKNDDGDHPPYHVVQVAVGHKHALLLTDEGVVYSWGSANNEGQLGRVVADNMQKPTPIMDTFRNESGYLEVIVQVACGLNHCLALSQKGTLYSWGYNKAGQLGLKDYVPAPKAGGAKTPSKKATSPTLVCGFDGTPNPNGTPNLEMTVKSCSCGPESSACVTMTGDVYVWGAISFYMFGEGRMYDVAVGENCTKPVKLRGGAGSVGLPSPMGAPTIPGQRLLPDKIALYKNRLACTIAHEKKIFDLQSLIESRKMRANVMSTASRLRENEIKASGGEYGGADMDASGLKDLVEKSKKNKEALAKDIREMNDTLKEKKEELRRITRELTICDQQDTAYNENASILEVKRSEGQEAKKQHMHLIDSQLNDINQFRSSNRRNKLEYLAQRDKLEQESWKLQQELSTKIQDKEKEESQAKLFKALQDRDVGKTVNTAVDDGLRISASKREELAATFPETLAGAGRFSGFQEVLTISEKALQDVSSALKEVSAVATGGDGSVMEEALEANLKLRKEYNTKVNEKLKTVMGVGDKAQAGIQGLMEQFFDEIATVRKKELGDGGTVMAYFGGDQKAIKR